MSDEKKEEFEVDTIIIPDVENHFAIVSGKNRFTIANYMPFIDGHMHIQSNNCAPLTLQWALVREAAAKIIDVQGADRKGLNVFSSIIMNLGEVGRLGTDYIAKLFMNDMARFKIKEDLTWTYIFKSDLERFEKFRQEVEKRIGNKELEDYTSQEKMELEKIKADERMNEDEKLNQQLNYVMRMMQKRDRTYGTLHEYAAYYFKQHKLFHMYIALPMDMSYAHYWGEFGLPIYIPLETEDKKGYYFINDFNKLDLNVDEQLRGFDDINGMIDLKYKSGGLTYFKVNLAHDVDLIKANNAVKDLFVTDVDGDENNKEKIKEFNGKKYKHFLEVVPGETEETFEDYRRQIRNTMIAGVLYPFEILPFYHYDPRRHNKDDIDTVLNKIRNNHIFFSGKKIFYQGDQSISLKKMDVADIIEKTLKANNQTNDFVKNLLLPNTSEFSFFGIKMYPKLGYAPYDYDRYPQLKDFFRYCADNKIPITSHCSPGGMTIADSHIYLKEAKKDPDKPGDKVLERAKEVSSQFNFRDKNIHKIDDCHRFINETSHHPQAWAKVLKEYDLKLCFAHFGGEECWFKKRKEIKQYWVDDIIDVIKNHDHVYTDLAYFVNKWWNIKKTADSLAEKISSNMILKNRILMGSDWYMFEREAFYSPGVDVYYRKMFQVLKIVSEKVGFDAWYYFAVENPLKYLGFIEDGNDMMKDCSKAIEKFKAHKKYILEKVKNEEFCRDASLSNQDSIKEKIDQYLGSEEEKMYPGCKAAIKYTGLVNLIDLKVLRDLKDKDGNLLIKKKPG